MDYDKNPLEMYSLTQQYKSIKSFNSETIRKTVSLLWWHVAAHNITMIDSGLFIYNSEMDHVYEKPNKETATLDNQIWGE